LINKFNKVVTCLGITNFFYKGVEGFVKKYSQISWCLSICEIKLAIGAEADNCGKLVRVVGKALRQVCG
jgi:hypothetical protein